MRSCTGSRASPPATIRSSSVSLAPMMDGAGVRCLPKLVLVTFSGRGAASRGWKKRAAAAPYDPPPSGGRVDGTALIPLRMAWRVPDYSPMATFACSSTLIKSAQRQSALAIAQSAFGDEQI